MVTATHSQLTKECYTSTDIENSILLLMTVTARPVYLEKI
ncbi:hypothetical protein A33Q_1634 [Indibacter alkaliphilus LW1]|uniref:Uncharacterized protein n=1 Tax=Indibacter alkaliphilus (strain CCUG 57479 / KCTC 22604 / LW1) TaxID=1189612 RepID=S2DKR9_INDAL|nr:hypothetical protein A33Q_1634 [Indibacter alkaliphilus LW1]